MEIDVIENVSLAECRRAIFDQFNKLKAGDISIDEALASSKMIHQVINSYDVETKAIEVGIKAVNAGIATGITPGTILRIKD